MTGDRLIRPSIGTAAGVPYVALPPTAVDADPDGPVRLVAAWHGFDPPRTESAFSAAVPMTGLPAWRVYLRLPMPVGWPPPGRDDGESCALAAEQAAEVFPAVLDEVRTDLAIETGPIGLVGMSAGALAALLTLADQAAPVAAAALISPYIARGRPSPGAPTDGAADGMGERAADGAAARLDFAARANEIARNDTAVILIAGADDELVTTADLTGFRDLLRDQGMREVEAVTFRMGHTLAADPGTDAEPPTAEAINVDGTLTDWFRAHLGAKPRLAVSSTATASASATGRDTGTGDDPGTGGDLGAGHPGTGDPGTGMGTGTDPGPGPGTAEPFQRRAEAAVPG